MKKNYLRPETFTVTIDGSTDIMRPKTGQESQTQGGGEAKDRDDDYSEGGDSPIWGEGGKLW